MAEHVFVYRIGQLGDTLVSLPAVRAIAGKHAGARMTLITNPTPHDGFVDAWSVMRHTGLFHDVMYLAPRVASVVRLVARLRLRRGATLYYLAPQRTRRQRVRDQLVFRHLCGIQRLVGMGGLDTWRGPPRHPDGSLIRKPRESDRLLEVAGFTPADVGDGALLVPPPASEAKVAGLLAPLDGRPVLGVGPGSKMPAKRWFLDRFVEVLQRTTRARPELGFVVLGGPEDRAAGDHIVEALPAGRCLNLAGETNVIDSAAALERCLAYLGNDTGTMHLAASMETPCLAIFTSRENPGIWEPWGEGHVILRRDLPCSGCMLTVCEKERMRCLDLITVDEVFDMLARVLDRQLASG